MLDLILQITAAITMLSTGLTLGIGLKLQGFVQVFKHPKALVTGGILQLVVVPLTAALLLWVVNLPPELSLGIMIMAFCPGGLSSNMMTKVAGGSLELSLSLTSVISLISIISLPLLVKLTMSIYPIGAGTDISVGAIMVRMFLLMVVPVLFGVIFRKALPKMANAVEPTIFRAAMLLFTIVIVLAVADNWELLTTHILQLGPLFAFLVLALFFIGTIVAKITNLSSRERITVSLESCLKNSTLGMAVGGMIVGASDGIPPISLPSGLYGLIMLIIMWPIVLWIRKSTVKS